MKKLFDGLYEGKRVLITGHTGFKGAWLSLWLKELGAEVAGYALKPLTEPSMFNACELDRKVYSIIGDVRNREKLKGFFDSFRPEIVFHLAAQSLVRYSYAEPVETYDTNIMGTVNVLEACRHSRSVKVIINVTSDKCYENKEWLWGYREDDPMGGYDPYSSSKGCAELVTVAYRKSYFNSNDYDRHGVSISSARAGNVIGGGDWAEDRLIPDCIRSLTNGEPIGVRNPLAVRPWQFVLEPLRGYLTLAARMWEKESEFSDGWNFGPTDDNAVPVRDVVQKVIEFWGEGRWKDISETERSVPHEANFLKLNICKAQHLLGWEPVIDLGKALEMTVKWYKRYYDRSKNILDFSLEQLDMYKDLVSETVKT